MRQKSTEPAHELPRHKACCNVFKLASAFLALQALLAQEGFALTLRLHLGAWSLSVCQIVEVCCF